MKFRCDLINLENNLLIGRHVHECIMLNPSNLRNSQFLHSSLIYNILTQRNSLHSLQRQYNFGKRNSKSADGSCKNSNSKKKAYKDLTDIYERSQNQSACSIVIIPEIINEDDMKDYSN